MVEQPVGFTIKVVSERTGVSVHTLRAWERRYGVPFPNRGADNRYRLYGEEDIADVMFIKQRVDTGIAPAQASALLLQGKDRAPQLNDSVHPIARLRTSLLNAFIASDQNASHQILDEAFAMFTPEQVALEIIMPTMRAIGDKWLRAEMTVWQEHMASNIVQQKLSAVLQSLPILPLTSPHVVAVCAPHEEHVLGLLMFALFARRQNWRVTFLGQSVPLNEIIDVARASKPNAIVISVTTVIGLAGLIPWLDAVNRPPIRLAFGGQILNQLPKLHAHLPGAYISEELLAASRNLGMIKFQSDFWTPSKRVLNVVDVLRSNRLKIAGETATQFMAGMSPQIQRKWDVVDLNRATLFLVDALSCALAYDTPELMDLQRDWLKESMPPRLVRGEWILKHITTFAQILSKTFSKDQNRLYQPLVERMKL